MIVPTAEQERLLRAALSPPAATAVERHSLRELDPGSLDMVTRRLLPLLYRGLRADEEEGALLAAAGHEYRRTAARNAALFDRGRGLLAELNTAGVATVMLKGAALVEHYYRDPGLRPMADLDLLIRRPALFPALAAFQRAGWTVRHVLTSSLIRTVHAAPFATADGFTCDLHWRTFPEPVPPAAEEALWADSMAVDFRGTRTRVLSPTDQLLHVCVHGARWAPVPAVWWVADAVTIIRVGDVDWPRLVARARMCRFVLRIREAFGYLRDRMGAAIPAEVLATLRGLPVSVLERLEGRVIAREHRALGALPVHWCHHLRASDGDFPRYLRDVWGLKSVAALPRAMASRAVMRAAAALRRLRVV